MSRPKGLTIFPSPKARWSQVLRQAGKTGQTSLPEMESRLYALRYQSAKQRDPVARYLLQLARLLNVKLVVDQHPVASVLLGRSLTRRSSPAKLQQTKEDPDG